MHHQGHRACNGQRECACGVVDSLELILQYNTLWIYPEKVFDTLLFLQYISLFTAEFERRTRSDISQECAASSDFLIEAWLEEKYPGQPTEARQGLIWTTL
ncbi:hypothetical protein GN244_ATG10483 [Phytophthora infestans]|uniref:Uncharacterized protein n=1 Tax=Phytophthora infestans TaxID=4787 RepID=A0A833T1Q1_PHYIN|nr:hypothetical protein GN244_ATG10483 [Phytophthora infestans]